MRILQIGIICCILLLQSCYAILGRSVGFHNKTAKITTIDVDDKDVAFLGMMHLAKKKFYEDVTKKVKRYESEGYVVYLEGNSEDGPSIRESMDSLSLKKMRKILNVDLSRSYLFYENEVVKKLIKKYELIGQPSYNDLGVTSFKYADVNYIKQVEFFESKHGDIVLDSCDKATPLGTQYNCITLKHLKGVYRDEVILGLRNTYLAQKICTSDDKKILVLYGKNHLKGLQEEISKRLSASKK